MTRYGCGLLLLNVLFAAGGALLWAVFARLAGASWEIVALVWVGCAVLLLILLCALATGARAG